MRGCREAVGGKVSGGWEVAGQTAPWTTVHESVSE